MRTILTVIAILLLSLQARAADIINGGQTDFGYLVVKIGGELSSIHCPTGARFSWTFPVLADNLQPDLTSLSSFVRLECGR